LSQQPVPGTHSAFAKTGAGRSVVPYLALHPMGFSVPPRLRSERWALTPPFHPYPALSKTAEPVNWFDERRISESDSSPRFQKERGGVFSVALSVGTPLGVASRVYPAVRVLTSAAAGYAASRPMVFGLSSPPKLFGGAILRPSKITDNIWPRRPQSKPGKNTHFPGYSATARSMSPL